MTDLSAPLEWKLPDGAVAAAASRVEPDKVSREAFAWPTPPLACYPAPVRAAMPEVCEVEGLNGKIMPGRLALFPSTMWHGTVPFADGERLTIAFDVARPWR